MYTPCHMKSIITSRNLGDTSRGQYSSISVFSKQNVFCIKIDLKNSKQKLLPFSQSAICCICYLVIEVVCLNIQLCRISLKFGDNLYLEKIIYTHSMGTEDHGGIPFLYLNSYIYNTRSRHFVMLDLFELLYGICQNVQIKNEYRLPI